MSMAGCPRHEVWVGRIGRAAVTPVDGMDSDVLEASDPGGAEIHVDENLHGSHRHQRNFPFFGAPCGIAEGRPDVFIREIGVEPENLRDIGTGSQQTGDGTHRHPRPPDTGFTTHHHRIEHYSLDIMECSHGKNVTVLGKLARWKAECGKRNGKRKVESGMS